MDVAQVMIDASLSVIVVNSCQAFFLFVLACLSRKARSKQTYGFGIAWCLFFAFAGLMVGGLTVMSDMVVSENWP